MKIFSNLLTPASLFFLVIGLGVGGLMGWNAGSRSGNFQGTRKSIQTDSRVNHSGRSDRRNADLDKTFEAGNPNVAANSKDLAKAVRSIFRENVKDRRVAMFEKMVASVGLDRFPDLVALIRENDLSGNDSGDEWARIWMNWSKRDPVGAMDFVDQFDWTGWNPMAPGHARQSTLSNWAQIDPQAVSKYVEDRKELLKGDRAMIQGLVEGWSNVDPTAAADWLFKTGLGRSAEYEKVIQSMTRSGGQESVDAWSAGLDPAVVPPSDLKSFAKAIAEQKQKYEPEKAAAWLGANLKEPWVQDSEIVGNTARAFAGRDPKAAMEWAGKTGLGGATMQAMEAWCQNDLDTASQWLNENLQNPTYAESAQVVMVHLMHRDPAAARRWAENMEDKALSDRLMKAFGNQ
ncbi:MAG: hypothetical protein V4819_19430 [Verrucomicrobiota bacterium]